MNILNNIALDIPQDAGKDFLTKLMGGRINPQLEQILDSKRAQCAQQIEPKAVYELFPIKKVEGEEVFFSTGHVFKGPNISKILKGSEIALVFVFTLGHKIDALIRENTKSGDTLATIVMDALTTSMLTLLGEKFSEIAKSEGIQEDGWQATCTYSPGQYQWTIEEQKEIFRMIDPDPIGVSLNDSYLMIPFKSVSGVYGFGPADNIDKTKVACELCPRENCIGRKN